MSFVLFYNSFDFFRNPPESVKNLVEPKVKKDTNTN